MAFNGFKFLKIAKLLSHAFTSYEASGFGCDEKDGQASTLQFRPRFAFVSSGNALNLDIPYGTMVTYELKLQSRTQRKKNIAENMIWYMI